MVSRTLTVAAIVLTWAYPVGAQQSIMLEFNGGRVTLSARNAPVRAILSEWARLGGATIVNGDRVAGSPVTLELKDVPERQALDVVLRGVSGYMLAPRPVGSSGQSAFNRILILPTSAAPAPPPPAAAATRPGLQRPPIVARPPQPQVEELPNDVVDDDADQQDGPEEQEPAGVTLPFRPGVVRPPIQRNPTEPGEAASEGQPNDDTPTVTTTPSNPFGVPPGSSATPGMVTPLPRGQQQPGTPTRVQ